MPEQQMKKVYEEYKEIFSKNQKQSEYYNEIEKELGKHTFNCKKINEILAKIKTAGSDASNILDDIEELLVQHAKKLRNKLYEKQEGDLFDFYNTEVIKQLKNMQEKIDPSGILVDIFRESINDIIKEFEVKIKILLKENMEQMKQDTDTHQFMKVDTLLETYKTQLKVLQMLNNDTCLAYQNEFDDYYKILMKIPQSIDNIGLNDIKQNSQLFIEEEVKNKELQNLFTQIKTKVNNQIKQKIDEYEKQDNLDDQIDEIKTLENVFTQLPAKYTNDLQQKKKRLDEKLERVKDEESKLIENLYISNDFDKLNKKYEATAKNNITKRRQIEDCFQKMASKFIEKAYNSIEQLNIPYTLTFLAQANESLQIVQKIYPQTKTQFDDTVQYLTDKINEQVKSIISYWTKQLQEECLRENIKRIQSFYREFKNNQILHQNKELTNTMETIDKLFQDLSENIINIQNSVNQNDSKQKKFNLHQLIADYQEYKIIFQILKLFSENNFIKLIEDKQLINLKEDNFGFTKVQQLVKEVITHYFNEISSLKLIQGGIESEIATYHQSINNIHNHLVYICKLKNFSIGNFTQETFESHIQQLNQAIGHQYEVLRYDIDQLIPILFESEKQTQKSFNNFYQNLLSIAQNMKSIHLISSQTNTFLFEIKKQIKQSIERIQTKIVQVAESDNKEASKILIKLQLFSQNIMLFQTDVQDAFLQIFVELKRDAQNYNKVVLGMYQCLKDTPIGMSIIEQNPIFESQQRAIFNRKIQAFGIDQVLNKLKDSTENKKPIDIKNLQKFYEKFDTIYRKEITENLSQKVDLTKLIQNIKDKSKNAKKGKNITDYIPEFVALIFALWTLKNATSFFNTDLTSQSNDYLLQPHPAQVISIFRILGIGYDESLKLVGFNIWSKTSNTIINNLVEIRTGEGKSIILGVVSIIFALLGYQVNCVCYSKYLSERDRSSFRSLFEDLKVEDQIFYGTFNEICEKMINKNGDIREMIMKQVLKDYKPQNVQLSNENQDDKEVLLIDEVDVFFSKSFYGALYQPKVSICHDKLKELILYIWKNQTKKLKDIKNQSEYIECQSIFNPDYVFLLDEALKNMLFDLGELNNHKEYECIDGQLGYKEQDQINFKISIGYLTMWANCKEFEAKNVTQENRDKQLCIGLKCGAFSYAEIALGFKTILGVSGTLNTLTDIEKSILKKYNISSLTFIPSVYGDNNLTFKQIGDIQITDKDNQYLDFLRNIESNISRNGKERSVIIIFEDEQKLQDFFDCKNFADIRIQRTVIRLTEKCNDLEKKNFVREATLSGNITLATKTFGRGTDFISLDKELNQNGGIHVIQTFFSTSLSEEVQIKGRTARQGSQGSYCMILLDSELSQFNLSQEEIAKLKQMKDVYSILDEKRNAKLKTVQEIETKGIEQKINKPHKEAELFRQNLLQENTRFIKDSLLKLNKGKEQFLTQIRTLILMDATGSMSGLILNTKNEIQEICQRVQKILDETQSSLVFQIQIAAYRNYDAPPNLILENSPWETNYENLRVFLNTIKAQYGMGPEAIEVGLWHAGQQVDILSQVLLIGDAPPNSQSHVEKHIRRKPYKSSKFKNVNYYEKELETLIQKKIPVHAYYVDKQAKEGFQKIANLTGGNCSFLDVNSQNGSDDLRDSIAKQLLICAGQSLGVKNLVELYDKYYSS